MLYFVPPLEYPENSTWARHQPKPDVKYNRRTVFFANFNSIIIKMANKTAFVLLNRNNNYLFREEKG